MNQELLQLNQLLAKKEELANQMTENDGQMQALKGQYEVRLIQGNNWKQSLQLC